MEDALQLASLAFLGPPSSAYPLDPEKFVFVRVAGGFSPKYVSAAGAAHACVWAPQCEWGNGDGACGRLVERMCDMQHVGWPAEQLLASPPSQMPCSTQALPQQVLLIPSPSPRLAPNPCPRQAGGSPKTWCGWCRPSSTRTGSSWSGGGLLVGRRDE